MKSTFVFCACGDAHLERIDLALRFLKQFSRSDIVVIAGRSQRPVAHDQVLRVRVDTAFDDHQASILIKTSLPKYVGRLDRTYCYLDSDVVAVRPDVDTIFTHRCGPVTFASDHTTLRRFSRYALRCGCVSGECDHLRLAIQHHFLTVVTDPHWQLWNGGVFLFDTESAGFMEAWHQNTLLAFEDQLWRTRDQGTLAATVWQHGLQHQGRLPSTFNYLVDPLYGVASDRRAGLAPADYRVDRSYALRGQGAGPRPSFLHLINGGMGATGWKNWDDAASLLAETQDQVSAVARRRKAGAGTPHVLRGGAGATRPAANGPAPGTDRPALTADNRIVHGMWVGDHLSRLELLTLHSFLAHGHEFHLWLYDALKTPIPREVVVEDAATILPRAGIFRKREVDPETGVGQGSYGAPFSDLFRYRLLYEHGGYWADMDITCLRPLDFETEYVFRTHRIGVVGNIMKCPRGSLLMLDTYEQVRREADEEMAWLRPNRVLSANVQRLDLGRFVRPGICNEDSWLQAIRPLIEQSAPIPEERYVIHWINEFWRTLQVSGGLYRGKPFLDYLPDKDHPRPGSTLDSLYGRYGL